MLLTSKQFEQTCSKSTLMYKDGGVDNVVHVRRCVHGGNIGRNLGFSKNILVFYVSVSIYATHTYIYIYLLF